MYIKNKDIQFLNEVIDSLTNEELENLLKRIKVNSSLIDGDLTKLLVNLPEKKKELLLETINELEQSNESQNIRILMYIFLINNAYNRRLNIEYDFFIKNIASKIALSIEDKIKCLNSSIEPLFNAIKGIKTIFDMFNIKLSLDDLIGDKHIISFICKRIRENEREIKEIEDDEEVLEQLEKNIKLSEALISSLIENSTIVTPPTVSTASTEIDINKLAEQLQKKLDFTVPDNKELIEKIENLEKKLNNLQTSGAEINIDEESFTKKIIDNMNNSATSIIEKIKFIIEENSANMNKASTELTKTIETLKEEWGERVQELDKKIAIFEESASKIDNLYTLLEQINLFIKENIPEIKTNNQLIIELKQKYEHYEKEIKELTNKAE